MWPPTQSLSVPSSADRWGLYLLTLQCLGSDSSVSPGADRLWSWGSLALRWREWTGMCRQGYQTSWAESIQYTLELVINIRNMQRGSNVCWELTGLWNDLDIKTPARMNPKVTVTTQNNRKKVLVVAMWLRPWMEELSKNWFILSMLCFWLPSFLCTVKHCWQIVNINSIKTKMSNLYNNIEDHWKMLSNKQQGNNYFWFSVCRISNIVDTIY